MDYFVSQKSHCISYFALLLLHTRAAKQKSQAGFRARKNAPSPATACRGSLNSFVSSARFLLSVPPDEDRSWFRKTRERRHIPAEKLDRLRCSEKQKLAHFPLTPTAAACTTLSKISSTETKRSGIYATCSR